MKSKRLSCEKALFLKNITKCWFVPVIATGIYLFIFVMNLPRDVVNFGMNTNDENVIKVLYNAKYMFGQLNYVMIGMGAVLSLISFDFLHKREAASFYASLPVTRTEVFVTVTLSNMFMIFVSTLVCVGVSMALITTRNIAISREVYELLIFVLLTQVLGNTAGTFCMVLGGKTVNSILYSFIVIFGGTIAYTTLQGVSKSMLWNYSSEVFKLPEIFEYLIMPTEIIPYSYFSPLGEVYLGSDDGLSAGRTFAYLAILIVIFLLLGILIYRRMKFERIGRAVTVSGLSFWVKLICSVVIGLFITSVYSKWPVSTYSRTARISLVAVTIFGIFIAFLILSLLETKNLESLKQDMVKLCLSLAVITVLMIVFVRVSKAQLVSFPEEGTYSKVTMTIIAAGEYPDEKTMSREEFEQKNDEFTDRNMICVILDNKEDIDEFRQIYSEYYEAMDGYDIGKMNDLVSKDYIRYRKEVVSVYLMPAKADESGFIYRELSIPANDSIAGKMVEFGKKHAVDKATYIEYRDRVK